jgi:hypothetical protein
MARTSTIDTEPTADATVHQSEPRLHYGALERSGEVPSCTILQGIIDKLSWGKGKSWRNPRPIQYPIKAGGNDYIM